jgi:hypothetical protein
MVSGSHPSLCMTAAYTSCFLARKHDCVSTLELRARNTHNNEYTVAQKQLREHGYALLCVAAKPDRLLIKHLKPNDVHALYFDMSSTTNISAIKKEITSQFKIASDDTFICEVHIDGLLVRLPFQDGPSPRRNDGPSRVVITCTCCHLGRLGLGLGKPYLSSWSS